MKKMLIYNSNSSLGKLALKAAKLQKWDIHILKEIYFSDNIENLYCEIKQEMSVLIHKKSHNTNLTWVTPELAKNDNIETEYFNYTTIPILISLAFSETCDIEAQNSITLIGRTFGIDFIEGFSELLDIGNDVNNSLLSSLTTLNLSKIVPLTKYLAFKLGRKKIIVNSAAFGPIEEIDDKTLIENHKKKMINLNSFTKKDVIESLDLFYDASNQYMTGQIIKYDGGASIC